MVDGFDDFLSFWIEFTFWNNLWFFFFIHGLSQHTVHLCVGHMEREEKHKIEKRV